LRAIRYEARLGFRMDGHTLSLARGSIETRLVGDLSSARLRDELLDILAEEKVSAALERIAELGLDQAMHPRLDAGSEAIGMIERSRDLMSAPPFHAASPTLISLACLCRRMPADEVYAWLDKLRMRRSDQDVIAACVTVAPLVAERLSSDPTPPSSQLLEMLGGQPVEVLLMAVVVAVRTEPVEASVRRYLEQVREVGLEISGDDLRKAGIAESPAIGEALKQTLALKLDGQLEGRDAELEAALRLVREGAAAAE
jgi:tRNA nucleotidyltransferase (CCA-adding enzyme)